MRHDDAQVTFIIPDEHKILLKYEKCNNKNKREKKMLFAVNFAHIGLKGCLECCCFLYENGDFVVVVHFPATDT